MLITRADLSAAAWRIVEREGSLCPDCATARFATRMRHGGAQIDIGHPAECLVVKRPRLAWLATEWLRGQLRVEGIPVADYGDELVGAHRAGHGIRKDTL